MSLLIDALRKAEQARLEGELQTPSPTEGDGAANLGPREPTLAADASPLELEPMPASQGESYATRPPPTIPGVAPRAAARRLFEAKQPPPRRIFWPLVAALTTLAVVSLGGYLWWELQPRGLVTAAPPVTSPPLAAVRNPAPPSVPPEKVATPASLAAPPAAAPAPAPARTAPVATADTPRPPRHDATPSHGSFAPPPKESPADSILGPIRRGSAEGSTLPAALTNAYAAYNAGDLSRAASLYSEVLSQDPYNRDALDGMGAIALRQGREPEAEAWFRRSLTADPGDAMARASLAAMQGRNRPEQGESRMRSLVAQEPKAAPGYFALGNSLAAQNRWPEAQQAYFEAHTLDPGNPDYLFNLAVSLDRLRQSALARRFYGEALAAASNRTASFERGTAEARLQALATAQ